MYQAQGNTVVFKCRDGEVNEVARCDDATQAANLMNRARHLNDVKRQYTASARLFAQAEQLPGFMWNEPSA